METCQEIVDDLSYPRLHRKYNAIDIGKENAGADTEAREKMYFINNFAVRVTWCENGYYENDEGVETDKLIYCEKLMKSFGHGMVDFLDVY